MKKIILIGLLIVFVSAVLSAAEYEIHLNWDEFGGECNGFISGNIGKTTEFVNGVSDTKAFNGKLISLGEGRSNKAKQVFKINSDEGYFTFWIKDKFADDDMMADPTLIAQSKPKISIFKNGNLLELINIPKGNGLACKVFTLDAELEEIDREIRFYPQSRIILGKVVSATTGEALVNANIQLVDYYMDTQTIVTDRSGVFIFPVDVSQYTLSAGKSGFIGTTRKVIMGIDEIPREVIIALSPEIKEFRIVLTWGSRPRDLDAHLSGPKPEGGNFHIWYRNKMLIGGKDFLDRDDTDKYGPETVTIYKPAIGNYSYSVFDYSNRSSKQSKKLSRSGAQVAIYGHNKLLATFDIPEDQKGNCWNVFQFNEQHEIIPINSVKYVKDERNIR